MTFPGSVANSNKPVNMNVEFNLFNDNYARSLSSNQSFYAGKDSKTPNNNNNYNSNVRYNAWSNKSSNNDSDGTVSGNNSGSLAGQDVHQNSKSGSKHHHQHVRGMENIKLDNEGVHSNYIQYTGMTSKPLSNDTPPNSETPTDSSTNQNSQRISNYPKVSSNHHGNEFQQFQSANLDSSNNGTGLDCEQPKKIPTTKTESAEGSGTKFLLNVDEDELVFYDDDIIEITRFESDNNNEPSIPLVDEKKYGEDSCDKSLEAEERLIPVKEERNSDNIDEMELGKKKKKLTNKNNDQAASSPDSGNSLNVPYSAESVRPTSFNNMELANSEGEL